MLSLQNRLMKYFSDIKVNRNFIKYNAFYFTYLYLHCNQQEFDKEKLNDSINDLAVQYVSYAEQVGIIIN